MTVDLFIFVCIFVYIKRCYWIRRYVAYRLVSIFTTKFFIVSSYFFSGCRCYYSCYCLFFYHWSDETIPLYPSSCSHFVTYKCKIPHSRSTLSMRITLFPIIWYSTPNIWWFLFYFFVTLYDVNVPSGWVSNTTNKQTNKKHGTRFILRRIFA